MEETIRLTEDLIRFKSTHNNPSEIQRCADYIEAFFNAHAIDYQRLNFQNYPSLLAVPRSGQFAVILMTHIDVVEGAAALFEPRRQDGKLFGRGSIDDKYAAALSLVLLKEHLQRCRNRGGGQQDLPFGILITTDEEIGGVNGAKKVLPLVKADFCIALDGGSVDKIVVKEKGILRLKLITEGKSAHGARPWLGENAIEKLIEDYRVIRTFFKDTLADHWHRTINFSRVKAGASVNQVPDSAEALFDIRYTENDDIEALVEAIQGKIDGRLVIEEKEPLFLGGESPYLDELLKIAAGTGTGFEHGASDARYLSQFGIKGIVWGADGDMSQHTAEEHLNISSVFKLYEVLDQYLDNLTAVVRGGRAPARK
ncbi:MAG: M20/M25/M40 family metallo-hydrolase [Desulfobacterales bacterium]